MSYICKKKVMEKILVIHPNDRSTDFLKVIYEDIPNKTVVTGCLSKNDIHELIKQHDRIFMLGHGCHGGLFSVDQFDTPYGLLIDYSTVDILKEKENNVYIWCNADQFVNKYNLKGFYSGMFISEVDEAGYCGVYGTDQEIVDESNNSFCKILSTYINENKDIIYENVKFDYSLIAENNPVALYNYNRLYKN